MLNRYLAETRRAEDLDALAALPFFLAVRAAIRAKVTAARMERATASERAEIAKSARAYFEFARRAIAPAPPKFIAVGGLSGTGKSRLARDLAPHVAPMPGAVIVRSDVERKALFGAGETEKLAADAYTPAVTERVYAAIADKAVRIVAAGHSAIVDAVFARPQERDAIAEAAKAANIPPARPVPHRESGNPNRPRRRPRRRRVGCRPVDCPRPGKLRLGPARMGPDRRFRHCRGHPGTGQEPRCRHNWDDDNCSIDETGSEPT